MYEAVAGNTPEFQATVNVERGASIM